MTQREIFAAYLEREGCKLVLKTQHRWTYFNPKTIKYYHLGASGSWRRGRNVTNSVAVSEEFKRSVLAGMK